MTGDSSPPGRASGAAIRRERAVLRSNVSIGGTLTLAGNTVIWRASFVGRVKAGVLVPTADWRHVEIDVAESHFTLPPKPRQWSRLMPLLVGASTGAFFWVITYGSTASQPRGDTNSPGEWAIWAALLVDAVGLAEQRLHPRLADEVLVAAGPQRVGGDAGGVSSQRSIAGRGYCVYVFLLVC